MRHLGLALILAASAWGCDAKAQQADKPAAPAPSYTARVKIDDV